MRGILTLIVASVFLMTTESAFAHQGHHKAKTAKGNKKATLYYRLGEKKALTAVVEDFVGRAATDDRIKDFFKATAADPKRLKLFKVKLVEQLCAATQGPCKYNGKNMKDAHVGMKIQETHFTALVEDLVASLDKFKVPAKEKGELLAILGPLKSEIVEAPAPEASTAAQPQQPE